MAKAKKKSLVKKTRANVVAKVSEPKVKYRFNELTKVGRGLGSGKGIARKIETAEKLWELFLRYKKWSKANPYKVHQYGKVYQERQRALTFIGFEGWLCMNEVIYDLTHYENATDYRPTILKIRKECSMDTVTGALGGVYNANLASRLEGLTDKQDIKVDDNRKVVANMFPFKNDKDE